jgi:hypothetical protein
MKKLSSNYNWNYKVFIDTRTAGNIIIVNYATKWEFCHKLNTAINKQNFG